MKRFLPLAIGLAALLGIVIALKSGEASEHASPVKDALLDNAREAVRPDGQATQVIDGTKFIKETSFRSSLQVEEAEKPLKSPVGGVMPHHDLAAPLLGNFYAALAESSKPEIIVVIGPNHSGMGERFQSGTWAFSTYDGIMAVDSQRIDRLFETGDVHQADWKLYEQEHALGIQTNYLAHYFKEAKILPILVSETRDDAGIEALARALAQELAGSSVLVLCSVDFSHYLSLEKADANDTITKDLILVGNKEALIRLDNGFIDSPSSLVLAMSLINLLEPQAKVYFQEHDNSGRILHNPELSETTSYYTIIFE